MELFVYNLESLMTTFLQILEFNLFIRAYELSDLVKKVILYKEFIQLRYLLQVASLTL